MQAWGEPRHSLSQVSAPSSLFLEQIMRLKELRLDCSSRRPRYTFYKENPFPALWTPCLSSWLVKITAHPSVGLSRDREEGTPSNPLPLLAPGLSRASVRDGEGGASSSPSCAAKHGVLSLNQTLPDGAQGGDINSL